MPDEPTFQSDDPIGEIDDRIARFLARTIVHVRRFFPFYAGGVAFAIAMLVLPVVGGGGGGSTASLAGSSRGVAGEAAGSGNTAAAASGARSATGAGAAAAGFLGRSSDLASSYFDEGGTGSGEGLTADGPAGGAGAVDGRRNGTTAAVPSAPPMPDTPSSDVGDGGADEPADCSVAPPSPAPTVTPRHEVAGAQDTVEAAAHQSLPVDVASTSSPVIDDAVCSVPTSPVDVPSVPLPATPVGGPSASNPLLQLMLGLLFR